jgi:hypothetical protein
MHTYARVSALVLAALSLTRSLEAQSANASITARADVRQPITVTGARNLDFGIVIQGTPATVGVIAATSGRFDATGTASSNVGLTFALPANLTSGANNLSIASWTGCYNGTANNAAVGCTAFTPAAAATNTAFGAAGNLWVFVGATVSPTVAQAVGIYNGTVTMTLTYF